jgi:hypothetical protein
MVSNHGQIEERVDLGAADDAAFEFRFALRLVGVEFGERCSRTAG